jgi:hypothetical protein
LTPAATAVPMPIAATATAPLAMMAVVRRFMW